MKNPVEFLKSKDEQKKSSKKKAWLSNKTKEFFTTSALEAHRLDSSRPVSYYYELFVQRLREKYRESLQNDLHNLKEEFFKNGVIEN